MLIIFQFAERPVTMHALCLCIPSNSSAYDEQYTQVAKVCDVAYIRIFPILLSVAIVTNTINAMVLIRVQNRHSPTPSRLCLFWLAVTHCLTCVPLLIGASIRDRTQVRYSWAIYFAHTETPMYNALNCTCAYIIVVLSVDRYKAVCGMHNYSLIQEFRNVPRRILLAYIIPFIVYIPICFVHIPMLNDDGKTYHIGGNEAVFDSIIWKIWAVLLQICHRIIPAIALTVINTKLLTTLTKLKRHREKTRKVSHRGRSKRDRQLMRVLLALTIVFLLTNVPSGLHYIIYVFFEEVCDINYSMEVLRAVANCFEMTGYSCDFFLYFLMNKEYRRGFRRFYKPCFDRFCKNRSLGIFKFDSITNTGECAAT